MRSQRATRSAARGFPRRRRPHLGFRRRRRRRLEPRRGFEPRRGLEQGHGATRDRASAAGRRGGRASRVVLRPLLLAQAAEVLPGLGAAELTGSFTRRSSRVRVGVVEGGRGRGGRGGVVMPSDGGGVERAGSRARGGRSRGGRGCCSCCFRRQRGALGVNEYCHVVSCQCHCRVILTLCRRCRRPLALVVAAGGDKRTCNI